VERVGARRGVEIHRAAIGARRETRTVHLTNHSMCTSLYRPDECLMRQFHGLEVAYLRDTAQVETVSIDELAAEGRFGAIDFVKIDIQGAELDAFRGAVASLASAVAIVSEVESRPSTRTSRCSRMSTANCAARASCCTSSWTSRDAPCAPW